MTDTEKLDALRKFIESEMFTTQRNMDYLEEHNQLASIGYYIGKRAMLFEILDIINRTPAE